MTSNQTTQQKLMTNWRWWLCSLLFVATTVNYLDRQVLSLTYEDIEAIGYDTYLCTVSNGDKVIVDGKGQIVR